MQRESGVEASHQIAHCDGETVEQLSAMSPHIKEVEGLNPGPRAPLPLWRLQVLSVSMRVVDQEVQHYGRCRWVRWVAYLSGLTLE